MDFSPPLFDLNTLKDVKPDFSILLMLINKITQVATSNGQPYYPIYLLAPYSKFVLEHPGVSIRLGADVLPRACLCCRRFSRRFQLDLLPLPYNDTVSTS